MVRSPRSIFAVRSSSSADSPSAAPGPPAPPSARGGDRGSSGAIRLLLVIVAVGALGIGAAVYGPGLVESIDGTGDGSAASADDETPPPTGDDEPDAVDPDDPGESSYDGKLQTVRSSAVEERVRELVDEEREQRGLEPLPADATIASVSRAHSYDMHERDFFAHQNPDGEGPFDRFRDVSDYCRGYGENVASTWIDRDVEESDGDVEQYNSAEEVAESLVEGWLDSQTHRETMLGEEWDRAGVGVYITDDGRVYATHNFCAER